MTAPTEYEIARDAARAAREAARDAHSPEARFFLKGHAELLERIAAGRRPAPRRASAGRRAPAGRRAA
jgi:hypothetical protein